MVRDMRCHSGIEGSDESHGRQLESMVEATNPIPFFECIIHARKVSRLLVVHLGIVAVHRVYLFLDAKLSELGRIGHRECREHCRMRGRGSAVLRTPRSMPKGQGGSGEHWGRRKAREGPRKARVIRRRQRRGEDFH
jgi:hypothetical protein